VRRNAIQNNVVVKDNIKNDHQAQPAKNVKSAGYMKKNKFLQKSKSGSQIFVNLDDNYKSSKNNKRKSVDNFVKDNKNAKNKSKFVTNSVDLKLAID